MLLCVTILLNCFQCGGREQLRTELFEVWGRARGEPRLLQAVPCEPCPELFIPWLPLVLALKVLSAIAIVQAFPFCLQRVRKLGEGKHLPIGDGALISVIKPATAIFLSALTWSLLQHPCLTASELYLLLYNSLKIFYYRVRGFWISISPSKPAHDSPWVC